MVRFNRRQRMTCVYNENANKKLKGQCKIPDNCDTNGSESSIMAEFKSTVRTGRFHWSLLAITNKQETDKQEAGC
jgi:hypothetical protein